jgi:hypothetical protein
VIAPRLRAGLVIGAVVVASAIAGAAIDRTVVSRGSRHAPRGGAGGGERRAMPEQEQRRRTEMLDRLTADLALTPAQRAGVDSIFQRTDSSLRAIRREMQPRLQQVFERSRAEIDARLDSAQRAKFAKRRRGYGGPRDWHGADGHDHGPSESPAPRAAQ